MKVLYLAEDYVYSKVHHNLCANLVKIKEIEEISVFGVLRDVGTPRIESKYGEVTYQTFLATLDGSPLRFRIDFPYKVYKKMGMLTSRINASQIDITYAATLFSEGAIAYNLFIKYGTPYVVAVRGSDINFYLKYMPHLWPMAVKILQNAKHVVFINAIVRGRLLKHWVIGSFVQCVKSKCSIRPNGIDTYWLENMKEQHRDCSSHRLLYIGSFDGNKNVESLQKAVLNIRKNSFSDITLTLVGGRSTHHESVMAICSKHPDVFTYLGPIYEKEKLAELMQRCDAFAMVSHSETFGLVYVESLSQGLPIIFTKGQGIDGYFEKQVGVAVDSHSIKDIERGIRELFENYDNMEPIGDDLNIFRWPSIAEEYYKTFKQAYETK